MTKPISYMVFHRGNNNNIKLCIRGAPRIWEGGQVFFFSDLGICMSRSDICAMRIARGFGGMLPREIFLKRCNLVRFRVYFNQILSLFFFQKLPFFI